MDCQSSLSGRQPQKADRLAHKSRMRHRRFLEKEALIEELARAFPLDDAVVGAAAGPRARSGADLAAAVPELPEALERSFGCPARDAEEEFRGLPAALSCERARLDAIVDASADGPAAGRGEPAKLDLVEQEQMRQTRYEKKLLAKLNDGDIDEATMRQLIHTKGRVRGKGGENETAEGGERLVDPSLRDRGGGLSFLSRDRGMRKQQQLGNFFHIVKFLLSLPVKHQDSLPASNCGGGDRKRLRVIDFGCGSGNLCLPLAWRFPDVEFVFVDRNQVSLDLVARRARQARLQNARTLQWEFDLGPGGCVENLERFVARIDAGPGDARAPAIGIGLHCCGSLTDIVMEACRMMGAQCVVCPCCNGNVSMQNASSVAGSPLRYPRHPGLVSEHDFVNLVCPMADHNAHAGGGAGPGGGAGGAPGAEARSSLAKHIVEYDRAMWARRHWQNVRLLRLRPASCSPKNLVILCFDCAAG